METMKPAEASAEPKFNEPMSTSLVARQAPYLVKIETFDQAITFAEYMAKSSFVPAHYRGKPADCLLAMQMGAELGLHPMQALQGIAVINGIPAVYGDTMLAICRSSPVFATEVFEEWFTGDYPGDDFTAHCRLGRITANGVSVHEYEFSIGDAKTAGLWNKRGRDGQPTPWVTYPKRMLRFRARNTGLRDTFTDLLKGFKPVEEVLDYDDVEYREADDADGAKSYDTTVSDASGEKKAEKPLSRTEQLRQHVQKGRKGAGTGAKESAAKESAPDKGTLSETLFDATESRKETLEAFGELCKSAEIKSDVDFRKIAARCIGRAVKNRGEMSNEEVEHMSNVLSQALHLAGGDGSKVRDFLNFATAFEDILVNSEAVEKAWTNYRAETEPGK